MCLGYTAHSIWDSSHTEIGGTQKKKIWVKDILNFKQKPVSVCLKLSMSQCMSLFLDNMKSMSSTDKFKFTCTEKYSILNIMFI